MSRAVWPTVQVALFGRTGAQLLAPRGARDVASARGECRKDRIEVLYHLLLTADHHAIAALQPPDAAASPDVGIVDAPQRQFLGPPDIVDVVGIAAVDQNVVGFESGQQVGD